MAQYRKVGIKERKVKPTTPLKIPASSHECGISCGAHIGMALCEKNSLLPRYIKHCQECESPFRLCTNCYNKHGRRKTSAGCGDEENFNRTHGLCEECNEEAGVVNTPPKTKTFKSKKKGGSGGNGKGQLASTPKSAVTAPAPTPKPTPTPKPGVGERPTLSVRSSRTDDPPSTSAPTTVAPESAVPPTATPTSAPTPHEQPEESLKPTESSVDDQKVVEVVYLSIDEIAPNPDQPRQYFDPNELKNLERGVKTVSMLEAIRVVKNINPDHPECKIVDNQCKWVILDGERRWRVMKALGKQTTIKATVLVVGSMEELFILSASYNSNRAPHTPFDTMRIIQRMVDVFGKTHKEVAGILCMKPVSIGWYLRVAHMNSKVHELMGPDIPPKERLNISTAREISNVEDHGKQFELAQQAVGKHLTGAQMKRHIASLRRDGMKVGDHHSKDSHNKWRNLAYLLIKLHNTIDAWVDITPEKLEEALANRSAEEITGVIEGCNEFGEFFSQFKQTLEQVAEAHAQPAE